MHGNSTDRLARLDSPVPTEVVILFDNEREYNLDRCVGIAEQALGLHAEGRIATDGNVVPPEVGASVQLVDVDGECMFYFGAPEQALVVVRSGNGGFFGKDEIDEIDVAEQEPAIVQAVRDHRAWVHLALDTRSGKDIQPERSMLLQKLTAGFMGDDGVLLHLPQHDLFVQGSAALRTALYVKSLAEALREARTA